MVYEGDDPTDSLALVRQRLDEEREKVRIPSRLN